MEPLTYSCLFWGEGEGEGGKSIFFSMKILYSGVRCFIYGKNLCVMCFLHNNQDKLGLYWAKLSSNGNWNFILLHSRFVA